MNPGFQTTPEWLVGDWTRACVEARSLLVQRCTSCGVWRHPPRRFCANCRSQSTTFDAVAGTGTVISFAISHRSLDPVWHAIAPFLTLVIELDEGPRVLAATSLQRVAIGDRVDVALRIGDDGQAILWATSAAEPVDRDG